MNGKKVGGGIRMATANGQVKPKKKRLRKIECKKCGRIFNKAEALGGHISKAHPADNSAYLAIPSKHD
jgi:hypothetical protein